MKRGKIGGDYARREAAEKLKRLARGGLGTWSGGKPRGASRPVVIKGKPVGDIVLEERR
jgi:hypothetical protein